MKTFVFFSFFLLLTPNSIVAQSYNITTVAGSSRLDDGSPATSVPIRYPYGVAQDAAGNIYFADANDNRVRRVGADGKISTVAGNGVQASAATAGPPRRRSSIRPKASGSMRRAPISTSAITITTASGKWSLPPA